MQSWKKNLNVKEYEIKLKKHNFTKNLVDVYITFEELNLCNLKNISYV